MKLLFQIKVRPNKKHIINFIGNNNRNTEPKPNPSNIKSKPVGLDLGSLSLSSLESTEKQKYGIEKFLASLLFELFDFEVRFQLEQNTSDYYKIQFIDVFRSLEYKNANNFSLAFLVFEMLSKI